MLAWIITLGAILRIAAAVLIPDQHFPDTEDYRTWSAPWRTMPLYPLLWHISGKFLPLIDVALSTVSIWLIYQITLDLFKSKKAALCAAGYAAIYPFFIFYSTAGLTETLFITLLLASFLAWQRGQMISGSIFAVLGILTRPTFDLLNPLLITLYTRQLIKGLCIYGLTYIALMSPWWIYNYQQYGTFVRLNLGSGMLLYAGNNDLNKTGGGIVGLDWNNDLDRIDDLVARDRAYRARAVEWILSHPGEFVRNAGIKLWRFWQPWPYAKDYRSPFYAVVSAATFLPIVIGSLFYFIRFGPQQVWPILILIGYLTLVHCVFVSSIRYRLPLEPFLIVLAARSVTNPQGKTRCSITGC